MRVLVVTPTYNGKLRNEMREALAAQRSDGLMLEHMILDEQPWTPPDHRNVLHMYRLAQQRALAENFDAMWTVEHDIVLPPDAAMRLNETPGDVVYGAYMVRWGCYVLNVLEFVSERNIGETLSMDLAKLQAARTAGVVRCSGVGWGCTWIRKKALRKIKFPEEWTENPPYDIAFSQKALRAGLKLYANLDVECDHLKDDRRLKPFANDQPLQYDGSAWMVGGQLLPRYRPINGTKGNDPGGLVRIVALQTINARIDAQSMRLCCGEKYDLPEHDAHELARAGYVEVYGAAIP